MAIYKIMGICEYCRKVYGGYHNIDMAGYAVCPSCGKLTANWSDYEDNEGDN